MAEQFPVIIVIAPLFGAICVALLGFRFPAACFPLALASLALTLTATVGTLGTVLESGPQIYSLSGWERVAKSTGEISISIEYRVDVLSGIVLAIIGFVALLNCVFAKVRIEEESPGKTPHYYILSLLLVSGLAGMTITNDAFNLYVLLEISSLTSYALIAIGSKRAVLSAFNYVIMGTIGASFYLLGVGYLYIKTGTLNMTDIREALATLPPESASIHVAFMLIMVGVWIKMAFFPLHGWLPNAYAYSPTATGALMAPLVTKVMIYIMIRMMVSVFGTDYVFGFLQWSDLIVGLSVVAIVAGSFFALSRSDLRKMLTYLIVAEVGYMVGGAWLANANGMTGAIYHIASDALMTLCLFMAIGIIVVRTGEHRLTAFQGLYRTMPITMTGFTVGALSMIGLPPTCGFFSKWYSCAAASNPVTGPTWRRSSFPAWSTPSSFSASSKWLFPRSPSLRQGPRRRLQGSRPSPSSRRRSRFHAGADPPQSALVHAGTPPHRGRQSRGPGRLQPRGDRLDPLRSRKLPLHPRRRGLTWKRSPAFSH